MRVAGQGSERRRRRWFGRVLLVVLGSLFGVLLLEVFLQVFAPLRASPEVDYVPDGHLGVRLAPNRVYALKSGGTCTVNALGLRGTEPLSVEKPAGTLRIVALGGSSTFSYDVSDEQTWTAILEKRLREVYGRGVEVVNAGVPGYSVFESKIHYLYRIRALHPDVVIVYHTWNDMKLFRALESGALLQKGYRKEDWLRGFLRHSQVAWRLRNVYHQVVLPRQRENRYSGPGADRSLAIAPDGPAHRWERQNFEDLALLLTSDGVLPVFSSQATLLSSSNLEDPAVRAVSYVEYVGLPIAQVYSEWTAVTEIVRDVAQAHSIPFADAFHGCPSDLDHFVDHVHLSARGNQAVAEVLFATLRSDERFSVLARAVTGVPSPR